MTYREYLTTTTKRFNFSEEDITLLAENQKDIIPDMDAEVDTRTAKTALVREVANFMPIANISEGGYSLTWNIEALRLWYKITCAELGLAPIGATPTATNRSDIW